MSSDTDQTNISTKPDQTTSIEIVQNVSCLGSHFDRRYSTKMISLKLVFDELKDHGDVNYLMLNLSPSGLLITFSNIKDPNGVKWTAI